MENSITNILNKYENAFKEQMQELQAEIIKGSPVDKGRFKTSWKVELSRFKFTMSNNVEYGSMLWDYHRSKQGWSPIGGRKVVDKHLKELDNKFTLINNSINVL